MLRRFDRSLAIIDHTTRTGNGTGERLRAAKNRDREDGGGSKTGTDTIVRPKLKPKIQRPNLYRVLLLNDDYTPMEFVVLCPRADYTKTGE